MGEPGEGVNPSISEIKQTTKEIVGDKILGNTDPRTLTQEQFSTSPDLLFHGAISPFEFRNDFDFENSGTEGSITFGCGLYTIDNKETAQHYAEVRASHSRGPHPPTTMEFLPYDARVLDLRAKGDPNDNGSFPYDLAVKWKVRFDDYAANATYPDTFGGEISKHSDTDYAAHLEEIVKPDTYIHPRVLQMTHLNRFLGPPWSKMFSDFMVEQGYDGAILIEAAENKKLVPKEELVSQPTYVFYNMDKIGTYDAWQKKK